MIQHTVLFKFPSVASEVPVEISDVVALFNELPGIYATFEPHGVGIAGCGSKEEFLGKVEWPDKTEGYTHSLLIIAVDDEALKAYLHSDLHLKDWMAAVKPFATSPPLVFDTLLSATTVTAITKLQAQADASAAAAASAAVAAPTPAAAPAEDGKAEEEKPPPAATQESAESAPPPAAAAAAAAVAPPSNAGVVSTGRNFVPITNFGFDSGGYNEPWVTIYVTLPGVGEVKSSVECSFTSDSFDLKVPNLKGKNYRLLKTNLEKDIVPSESKKIVKADKVIVKLKKVKGDYSYETWQGLTSKKDKAKKAKASSDPTAGIMDMMKDMYEDGDDNMKKIIGEAMLKSQQERSGQKPDAQKGSGSMFDTDSMGDMPDF